MKVDAPCATYVPYIDVLLLYSVVLVVITVLLYCKYCVTTVATTSSIELLYQDTRPTFPAMMAQQSNVVIGLTLELVIVDFVADVVFAKDVVSVLNQPCMTDKSDYTLLT